MQMAIVTQMTLQVILQTIVGSDPVSSYTIECEPPPIKKPITSDESSSYSSSSNDNQLREMSDSSSSMETDDSKGCKCSCNQCYKPKECCIEVCDNCVVTQSVMLMPYPVPYVYEIPTQKTTTSAEASTKSSTVASTKTTEPSRKTTESSTKTTESSTKTTEASTKPTEPTTIITEPSTKTTAPSTKTAESSTKTTEKSIKTTSTSPALILNGLRCPNIGCITRHNLNPKETRRSWNSHIRPTLPIRTKRTIEVIRRRRLGMEIDPEEADAYRKQIQRRNEIRNQMSFEVQKLEELTRNNELLKKENSGFNDNYQEIILPFENNRDDDAITAVEAFQITE